MTALALLTALVLSAAGDDATITVGQRKQLFLDDYLVASMTNVRRRVHLAEKHKGNPVIWKTEPWEESLNVVYGSVIRDEEKYKMWYQSGYGVSYAESDDGITWTKPRLDLMVIDGQKTNVLFRKKSETSGSDELPYFQELFGVTKDPREADPSRRYKMCTLSIDWNYTGPKPNHLNQLRGVGVAGSPDGIHWKIIDSFATVAICDGATHWMFDPALQKYVLFGRTLKTPPEIEAAWSKYDWYPGWHSGRAVGRIESADLVKWNLTETGTAPVVITPDLQDEPGTEIYSVNVFPYESAYIGLLQVYLARPDACVLNVQLVASHDGVHFTRVGDRSSIISVGPVGSWERFNTSLANNPPITVGDDLRIYYGNRIYRHSPYDGKDTSSRTGGIGFATVKRDRFVSLEASFDGGAIVTKPLKLQGNTLHLNSKSDYGEIVVEVLAPDGKLVAKSRPIYRDSLDSPVEWEQGSLAGTNGPVVLRITLKNACLYALWCS